MIKNSTFLIGLYGQTWIITQIFLKDWVEELISLNCNKLPFYQDCGGFSDSFRSTCNNGYFFLKSHDFSVIAARVGCVNEVTHCLSHNLNSALQLSFNWQFTRIRCSQQVQCSDRALNREAQRQLLG